MTNSRIAESKQYSGDKFRYDAFISYRHSDEDRRWAKWLHSSLESYRPPKKAIQYLQIPARLKRIFRDEDELAATPNLSNAILSALNESRCLIVVCSPRTPSSRWINEEVNRFRELGRADHILTLLVEGEPEDSFPQSLYEIRPGTGRLADPVAGGLPEPLAADVRANGIDSRRYTRRMAVLRLVATIMSCNFDDLRQRDQERLTKRYWTAGISLSGIVLLVAILAIFAFTKWSEAERHLHYSLTRVAHMEWSSGDITQARKLLPLCPPSQRGWEWSYLNRLCNSESFTFTTHKGGYNAHLCFALSHDGTRIASSGRYPNDGSIRIWNAKSGREILEINASSNDLVFSPDGVWLASTGKGHSVAVWETSTGRSRFHHNTDQRRTGPIAYSPGGDVIFTANISGSNDLVVWNATTGERIRSWVPHNQRTVGLAVSSNGQYMATAGFDPRGDGESVKLWDTASGKLISSAKFENLNEHGDSTLEFTSDGESLIGCGSRGQVSRWSIPLLDKVKLFDTKHKSFVSCMAVSADNTILLTGSWDQTIKLWDIESGRQLHILHGHEGWVEGVSVAGDLVVSSSRDKTIKVWNVARNKDALVVGGAAERVDSVSFSHDSRQIAAVSSGEASIWDADTGESCLHLPVSDARCAVFAPHGGIVAVASNSTPQKIHLFSPTTGSSFSQIEFNGSRIWDLAYSPDNRFLAVALGESVEVWNATDIKRVHTVHIRDPRSATTVAFSHDGQQLAIAGQGIHIIDTHSWAQLHVYDLTNLNSLAWAPDDTQFVATSSDYNGPLLIRSNGDVVGSFGGHLHPPEASCFTPDSRRIVSTGPDGTVRIWDSASGFCLLSLDGPSANCMAVSPDGKRIAVGGDGAENLKVWTAGE